MDIKLKYGTGYQHATVSSFEILGEVIPKRIATLRSPREMLTRGLEKSMGVYPFSRLFRRARGLVLVLSAELQDHSGRFALPHLLDVLAELDVPEEEIRIVLAGCGQQAADPADILDERVLRRYQVFIHDYFDMRSVEYAGETRKGIPVFINKHLFDAEQIIILGSIFPHFLLGYTGGPRMVVPGCAGIETLSRILSFSIDTKEKRLRYEYLNGYLEANPIQEALKQAYRCLPASFGIYPVFNDQNQVISVYAGHPLQAHVAGTKAVECLFKVSVAQQADVTLVSTGGAPLDDHFHAVHQALFHAATITRPGGVIILLAACKNASRSKEIVHWLEHLDNRDAAERPHTQTTIEAVIAYSIRNITDQYTVIMVSELEDGIVRNIGFEPAGSLEEAVDLARQKMTTGLQMYILPEGFKTVPLCQHPGHS